MLAMKEAAEAAALEVECADFPGVYADGKDELTLRVAVAEEVLRGRDECLPGGGEQSPRFFGEARGRD